MSGPRGHCGRRGLTLLESMILLTIFSMVTLGVSVGLQSATDVTDANDHSLAITTELISEAENWRAVAFSGATWPASVPYSLTDTVTMSVGGVNRTYARTTTITNWDPTNIATNASPQANFVQIKITINGQTLVVYVCKLT